jgi:cell shape-determining protein MreC
MGTRFVDGCLVGKLARIDLRKGHHCRNIAIEPKLGIDLFDSIVVIPPFESGAAALQTIRDKSPGADGRAHRSGPCG